MKQKEHNIRPVSSATGTAISRQNVHRRLGKIGLHARRPTRCVPHTVTHCRQRLAWSRRAPGTRYHQENIIEQQRFDGAGLFVWGWGLIILSSRTDLHAQIGTITDKSIETLFWNNLHVCFGTPWAHNLNDNAHHHRSNIVEECLQSDDITRRDKSAS
ncbi:HTH_Tnp_Tc3_2 domain-containing protein [Trichonephila clavipes]|nr:HTH_Tnp_Tc3_2 domain-containing protein [Trichonephila clavipes]